VASGGVAGGVGRVVGQRQAGLLLSGIGAGLFLAWELRRNWRALVLVAGVSVAASFPFGAVYLWYNYIRWGSIYFTGYGLAFAGNGVSSAPVGILHESPLVGLYGMFFSPGKSVFLYCPPLIVAALGFFRFTKRFRYVVLAMVLTILPSLYLHAQMISWAGDYAWGPRYMTFALAVLLLPAGFLLQDLLDHASRLRRWLGLACCCAVFPIRRRGHLPRQRHLLGPFHPHRNRGDAVLAGHAQQQGRRDQHAQHALSGLF
jgi:hypothetical protein